MSETPTAVLVHRIVSDAIYEGMEASTENRQIADEHALHVCGAFATHRILHFTVPELQNLMTVHGLRAISEYRRTMGLP